MIMIYLILMKPPILKTKNFTLRPIRKGDGKSLQKNINNKKIYKYTATIPYPYSIKDAHNFVKDALEKYKNPESKSLVWVIDIDGEVVGGIGFHRIVAKHKAEIGYWLAEQYWGKGIMTRALKETTKYGFRKLQLKRIGAYVFRSNKGSYRVLEKSGYKLEGLLRKYQKKDGKLLDVYLFSKVK